jgi:hypothetical protein
LNNKIVFYANSHFPIQLVSFFLFPHVKHTQKSRAKQAIKKKLIKLFVVEFSCFQN